MYHFDGDRVSAVVAGIPLFEFGQGEFLTVTPREQPFTEIAGHHGASARARKPAQLYDGKAMILKGSPVNAAISTKVKIDLQSGLGVGVFMIKDLEGSTLLSAQISYFGLLEHKFGTEPIVNEWPFVLDMPPSGIFEGANRFLVAA